MTGSSFDGEVVISGISCRLPESDNMTEFRDNLMRGIDMVTADDRRWKPGIMGLPKRNGKLKDLSKFDATFFGVHAKQAHVMSPQMRILLEVTYEAIVDAGLNPMELRGSNTGVFVGVQPTLSMNMEYTYGDSAPYILTGNALSMLPNRLSYFFDFKGPSFTVDTACSSTMYALDLALDSIRNGDCDAAIVGGTNLCLNPDQSVNFMNLGVLSPEGICRSFDNDAGGYCRSEGIAAFYLQKQESAKRVYCTVLHTKTNSDGYKQEGITFPSSELQTQLLQSAYKEAGVNPHDIAYMEAHATGTLAGDPIEANAIASVFCEDRPTPLLVGTVKSNMGHCENASGGAAIAKVIVAMETNIIPANLHYKSPNESIPSLTNGKMKIVDRNQPWKGGLIGVNSFGFGGSNAHAILRSNTKAKNEIEGCRNPRLVVYGSRSEEGVQKVLMAAQEHSTDLHFHQLLTATSHMPTSTHPYRGFTVVNSGQKESDVQMAVEGDRPVWFVFAGMGSQWTGMGKNMMKIDVFRNSILKSDALLKPFGVNLYDMIMNSEDLVNDITKSFVGIISIQVALVDVLTCMGVRPDGIVGHSVGELGCAYADGSLTAEEAVLAAYWRGYCVQNAKLSPGAMAAVGLTWEEALVQCPPGVAPACHNTEQSVTVSGPEDDVKKFVEQLQGRNVFAKLVNSAGVAFHSYFMKQVENSLKNALQKVIVSKPRTHRWISSSFKESDWSTDIAQMSSADYHVHNLVSPVLFHDALRHVPNNAVVMEISPHCLLQSVLKGTLSSKCCIVGLMKRNERDNVYFFLTALGKCYQNSVDLDPLKLFPPVTFPAPRGTPMISPLIGWDHTQSWKVPRRQEEDNNGSSFTIDTSKNSEYRDLLDHKVNGRPLVPATGYYVLAWRALAKREGKQWERMPVMFDETQIFKPTFLSPDSKLQLDVSFIPGSDKFQILHGGELVMDGKITVPDEGIRKAYFGSYCASKRNDESEMILTPEDIYKELSVKGFEYGPSFRSILKCNKQGTHGKIRWTGDWIKFIDAINHHAILTIENERLLTMPYGVTKLMIDPDHHEQHVQMAAQIGSEGIDVSIDNGIRLKRCGGVLVQNEKARYVRRSDMKAPMHERFKFIPYANAFLLKTHSEKISKYVTACTAVSLSLIEKRGEFDHFKLQTCSEALEACKTLKEKTAINIHDGESQSLFKLLCKANELPNDEAYKTNFKALVEKDADALKSDILFTNLLQTDYLKPCLDIVWENTDYKNLKFTELFNCTLTDKIHEFVSAQPNLTVQGFVATLDPAILEQLSSEGKSAGVFEWEPGCKVPDTLEKFSLVIANHVVRKQKSVRETLRRMTEILVEGGFILIHEVTTNFHITALVDDNDADPQAYDDYNDRTNGIYCNAARWREIFVAEGFEIIYEVSDNFLSSLFLIRKTCTSLVERQSFLDVSALDVSWLDQLKAKIDEVRKSPKGESLWLRADSNISGIMGMFNALRFEPGGKKLRYLFDVDGDLSRIDSQVMKTLVQRDLVANVLKNGQWGCYRHLPLEKAKLLPSEHAYVNARKKGDLSSLTWYQSHLQHDSTVVPGQEDICKVHYASLNFRDVMIASGKLIIDAIPGVEHSPDCMLGMEFSGTDSSGNKVMGLVSSQGLASTVKVQSKSLWRVPDSWSLEEAATVPVVYITAYYALVVRARIRPRHSVLIHSGSGGVGQAAIAVALDHGCKVFTTVGTEEKRTFLNERFPQLGDDCIFSSRDTAFENRIKELTAGKGVNIVLNSLAGEKLFASLRLVAKQGKFLEIGKFDMAQDTALGMSVFLKNIAFHGILTEELFEDEHEMEEVSTCLREGIKSGVVKPLRATVFDTDDVEGAFRYMAKGNHIGKVLIKVRDNSKQKLIPAVPRTSFYPEKTYIITGGLGGFGLELAQWLFRRGARHFILTSRSGVKTGYQMKKLDKLRMDGAVVTVSNKNVCNKDDVCQLLRNNGRPIGGIFHLAAVVKDALLENQTVEIFKSVCDAKVTGTMLLDEVSREVCKAHLDWFVVFSSIASGYGNAGQSNYSFANSVMERIIERRKAEGYPGLAIQWGPIGDVGVFINQVGDNDTVMGGTVPQRIVSCLQSLDVLLNQSEPIVCSYVLSDQSSSGTEKSVKGLVPAVCKILGANDPSLVDENKSLAELGLDSLLGVEIKLLLENDYNLPIGPKEIRELTLRKLKEIETGNDAAKDIEKQEEREEREDKNTDVKVYTVMPKEQVLKLNSVQTGTPMFFVHNMFGFSDDVQDLASLITVPVYGLQRTKDVPQDSIEAMAAYYIQAIQRLCGDEQVVVAGYSFGASVAMEMAFQLQSSGKGARSVVLLDGSPKWSKILLQTTLSDEKTRKEVLELRLPVFEWLREEIRTGVSEDQIVAKVMSMIPGTSEEEARLSHMASKNSMKMTIDYTPRNVYNSDILLVAAKNSMSYAFSTPDFGLNELCTGKVTVRVVPGNHLNFIRRAHSAEKVADIINATVSRF